MEKALGPRLGIVMASVANAKDMAAAALMKQSDQIRATMAEHAAAQTAQAGAEQTAQAGAGQTAQAGAGQTAQAGAGQTAQAAPQTATQETAKHNGKKA
jgi:hypothetical protein